MTNQMELNVGVAGASLSFAKFLRRFLDATFAQVAKTGLNKRMDAFKRNKFRNTHEGYFLGVSTRSLGRRLDTLYHLVKSFYGQIHETGVL